MTEISNLLWAVVGQAAAPLGQVAAPCVLAVVTPGLPALRPLAPLDGETCEIIKLDERRK